MPVHYFSCLWLVPEFIEEKVITPSLTVHRRKWDVSIFDLYSLIAEKHPLALPAELMHLFLQSVNLEVEITAPNFLAAADNMDRFRAVLCIKGVKPTIVPFAANYSLNQYAGINDRSSGLTHKMHEGLREGITHSTARIQTWGHELTFNCIVGAGDLLSHKLSADLIASAASDHDDWMELEKQYKHLKSARQSLVKAPLMPDISVSILQLWQGIESLFPNVSTEITFRLSLLLAELSASTKPRMHTYNHAKKSYADRSRIIHGTQLSVDLNDWHRAWSLLCNALQSVLLRKSLPDEDYLLKEVLARGETHPHQA